MHTARPAGKSRPVTMRVVVLIAAATLSTVAGCQLRSLWLRLPGVQAAELAAEVREDALRRAQAEMSPEAREGLIAANLAYFFTTAWIQPGWYAANRRLAQEMVGELRHTQIGRLQLAALLMLELERAGTPTEQWWPSLEPLLSGLAQASFPHFLPELIEHRTAVLESEPIGFEPGTARAYAEQSVGHPHGPFLQFLVERLQRVAKARRVAGDDSAQLCQRLTWRLLQQWTLAPGPTGLRLLAADLLAGSLETGDTTSAPARESELARRLREWREQYHVGAHLALAEAGGSVPLLSLRSGPEPDPRRYRDLLGCLAWTLWIAAATCAAALATVVSLAWCFSAALCMPRRYMARIVACLIVVAGILSIETIWGSLSREALATDLRRLGSHELGWPRQPPVAVAVTLGMIALTGVGRLGAGAPRRARLARVAYAGARIWLVLSLVLLGLGLLTGRVLDGYQTSLRAALDADEMAAAASPTAAGLLDGLRQWDPNAALVP